MIIAILLFHRIINPVVILSTQQYTPFITLYMLTLRYLLILYATYP